VKLGARRFSERRVLLGATTWAGMPWNIHFVAARFRRGVPMNILFVALRLVGQAPSYQ